MSQETVLHSQKMTFAGNHIFEPANVSARDFRHMTLMVSATNTASFKISILGSLQDTPPDFTAPVSETNNYQVVEFTPDNNTGAFTTSYTISADGTYMFEVNLNALTWVTLQIHTYTSGTCVGQFVFKNNA